MELELEALLRPAATAPPAGSEGSSSERSSPQDSGAGEVRSLPFDPLSPSICDSGVKSCAEELSLTKTESIENQ